MNTIGTIFGDYCKTAAMDTFVVTRGDKHPTDLAMLVGARLVMATEVNEGQVWDQAKVNLLTGGEDPITARFMRRDFFTFVPQLKLTISGNNKPNIPNVDDAARRRIKLAAFENKPANPDKTLKKRLKAEGPGILRWLINGCLKWQRDGLQPPESVRASTNEYFAAQDPFGRWMEECCVLDPDERTLLATAFRNFQDWSGRNGEPFQTAQRFRELIDKTHWLLVKRTNGQRQLLGMRLKPPTAPELDL